ncbi:DUF2779 domain-containing protein [Pontiellaceae bacterium B1224]|nr:DUF2779 domain-containing protein [Pontiellaceae bacterium B1224]
MSIILSKSKYCTGLQCPKLLWVNFNDKERLPLWDSSVQARFDQGHTIGELAKSLFPGGIEIEFRPAAFPEMIAETKNALKSRKPIFEATFSHDGAYAQADILVPVGDEAWNIVEVKSSTEVKNVYLNDMSFQLRLYESAGLKINRCFIMHINNQYVRNGDIEADKLLMTEDVTDDARALAKHVRAKMDQMLKTISLSDCPEVDVGSHCSDPYQCPLSEECWDFLPEEGDITTLYWTGPRKTLPLIQSGILSITDLPADYSLNTRQAIQRATLLSGQPHVNREAIVDFLGNLKFPQYHLDFETFQLAIPAYNNSRPYQQTVFQYSLHIWPALDAEPRHYEFLADGTIDPRLQILASLKENIGSTGDIVAYNMGFEKMCLRSSAEAFPEYRDFVNGLLPRFVDLLRPFRAFEYYHPEQQGSASIKKVLPVLVPELSYADLEIGDGGTASSEYVRVTFGDATDAEREHVREELLKYCHLDTLAMIRIIQALQQLVEA